ncbi:MAG: VanZ family protein [Deltaproteobacteria bacterium]|nr:VanZ family protein [Deltaproteobacteria bacterium]
MVLKDMIREHEFKIRLYIPFLCLVFVLYGSFIPFHIRSIPLIDAVNQFKHIPFLDLGIVSRADWVANILLYIPLGFFLSGWTSKRTDSLYKNCLVFLAVFLFCIMAAAFIEFFQIFFSPRTVSLNDLIAETLGSSAGIFLWLASGRKLIGLWFAAKRTPRPESALSAFLFLYLLFLAGITLFPFDFLISAKEIKWKYGMWKAQSFLFDADISVGFIIKTIAEAALFIPVGGFIGIKYRRAGLEKRMSFVFLSSFLIGFLIEFLQFFTASGVSQFFSVLVRVLGAFAGLFMVKINFSYCFERLKPFMKYIIMLVFPIYLALALKLSGWSKTGWLNINEGLSTFDLHMLLPFYFHYFSTETRAVVSVILNFGLYIPVGFSGWLLYFSKKAHNARYIMGSVFISIALSLFIETGKLFQRGLHPDFTNIIIAGFSAVMIFKLSDRIFYIFHHAFTE